eukprot:GEMP01061298.1.p1 GENE.GEMP01061298.1~~GEMP01061298.1.p1  ORF type:complete len:437 (+),score=68.51 GEMP01061298.1:52-1362(+)
MALAEPLCRIYINKLDNIIQEANEIICRLDVAVREFVEACDAEPFCNVDLELVCATTTSKTNLSILREAALRIKESLGEGEGISEEVVVVALCALWQQRQGEARHLLRYLDVQKLKRDTAQAGKAFFESLVTIVIDGEQGSMPSQPLGLRCRMRSIALIRRLRRIPRFPPDARVKAIRSQLVDISVVLDLHIGNFSELLATVDENRQICDALSHFGALGRERATPATLADEVVEKDAFKTCEGQESAPNARRNSAGSGAWTRRFCVKQLGSCRAAIHELLIFAIDAKCKAKQESHALSGRFEQFCADAHAVADMVSKLKLFIVPAVSIRFGHIPDIVFDQVEAFVQTRYLGGLWSEGRDRASSLSCEAFGAWLQWFLDGSGWNGSDFMQRFHEAWTAGINRRTPFAKLIVDYFGRVDTAHANRSDMPWRDGRRISV